MPAGRTGKAACWHWKKERNKKTGRERTPSPSACRQTPGMHRRGHSPFDCNPQAATCASPRSNRMLLPLSVCGRKMSISGHPCTEMPFYSKLMSPSKDCLQTFDGRASTLSMLSGERAKALSPSHGYRPQRRQAPPPLFEILPQQLLALFPQQPPQLLLQQPLV